MSLSQNNQAGTLVASGTTITGLLTSYGITSEDVGIIATFAGVVLSVVMIIGQIRRSRNEYNLSKLKQEKLQVEIENLKTAH